MYTEVKMYTEDPDDCKSNFSPIESCDFNPLGYMKISTSHVQLETLFTLNRASASY